jgi:hypothetical protein
MMCSFHPKKCNQFANDDFLSSPRHGHVEHAALAQLARHPQVMRVVAHRLAEARAL